MRSVLMTLVALALAAAPLTAAAPVHRCREEGVVAAAKCACHRAGIRAPRAAVADRDCCDFERGHTSSALTVPSAEGGKHTHCAATPATIARASELGRSDESRIMAIAGRATGDRPIYASNCVYRL